MRTQLVRALATALVLIGCGAPPESDAGDDGGRRDASAPPGSDGGGGGVDGGPIVHPDPPTAMQATQDVDGVTFTWDFDCGGEPCQVGTFLDGSPWVRHPAGGDVTITGVTPDDAESGLEKNPATGSRAQSLEQGLLACAGADSTYVESLDLSTRLPIAAPPDDGVYVKVQRYTGGSCGYTSAADDCCVNAYATLTVLRDLPPDGMLGRETFRPGMAGDDKVWVTTSDLDLSRLPQIAEIEGGDYASIADAWMAPYADYYTGQNGDHGRRWTPHARGLADYAAQRAEQSLSHMYRTFSADPLDDDKRLAVYALLQHALDLYAAYRQGVEWTGGAGQNQGRWHPLVYLGALSTDATIRANVMAATANVSTSGSGDEVQFIELYQVRPNADGIPIWGSHPGQDGCSQGGFGGHGRYWADYAHRAVRGESGYGKGTCGDPYGYIDGPAEEPGDVYAGCCSTGVYVSIALAMKIWPEFATVANYPAFVAFAERVMDGAGWWTEGDPCAVADPRESTSCSPYTEAMASSTCNYFGTTWGYRAGSCITIAEAAAAGHPSPGPRWPSHHLNGRPELGRGDPGARYWDMLTR